MTDIFGWRPCALNHIRSTGWLDAFLSRQRDGLTGHLEHAGYPFNTKGWRSNRLPPGERQGAAWWPYEQTAYWIDGMMRCGLLIGDEGLKQKARRQIDYVMNRPDPDGYLGPSSLKTLRGERGSERWPHTVFFRAVMADYDERPAKTTLRKLVRHYLSGAAPHHTARNVCNIEIMAWLYEKTGDRRMRDLAEQSYRAFQKNEVKSGATLKHMLDPEAARDHGPTYMELFKLGAVMYRITGKRRYLKASINAQGKLDRDHVLIDGVPSATEHLRGIYSTAGHETCVISDYVWSLGLLLQATGDARYADAMERACFNALPGAVTPDFKALQYFSGPNQVIAGPQTNHHPHGTTGAHVSYRPNPATECCPGNVHRAMPAFAGRMWMEDEKKGMIAALYGPSRVRFGRGASAVRVIEETNYPFEDRITFRFSCPRSAVRAFTFRIPGWCRRPEVRVNGQLLKRRLDAGSFVTLRREFRDGDVIELDLPRRVVRVRGPEDSVGFTWGPLVLSLPIMEKVTVEKGDARSSPEFPALTLRPASPWNYGVRTAHSPSILHTGEPGTWNQNPWSASTTPLRLTVPAHRIPGWKATKRKKMVLKHGDHKRVVEGELVFMPSMPDEKKRRRASKRPEPLTLVPYGATRLRITWFPVIKPAPGSGTAQ